MTENEAKKILLDAGWNETTIRVARKSATCEYCPVDARKETNFWIMTTDHILPRGGDCDSNLAHVCRYCNSQKGERLPEGMSADEFSKEFPNREDKVKRIKAWLENERQGKAKPGRRREFEAMCFLWELDAKLQQG